METACIVKGIKRKLLPEITLASDETLKEQRRIRVIAASGKADRVGDIIKIDGIEVENYMKNPIILWAHDHYALPVGKAVEVAVLKGKLVMTIQFATAEEYAFADTVYKLVLGGYLNGVSIGARVKEAEWIKDDDGHIVGRKFTSLELLELSIVPIPADSKALVTAVKAGKVTCEDFEDCVAKTFEAPLDLLEENHVQVNTDGVTTDLEHGVTDDATEDEAHMNEVTKALEARIAELEKKLTEQAMSAEHVKKTTDAVNTLFGAVMNQMEKKQTPDTQAILNALPEGTPVADMTKKMFAMLDQMTTKLGGRK